MGNQIWFPFFYVMIIEKKINLSSHSVQVAFLNPAQVESENFFLVFLHEALGSIPQWRDFPVELCQQVGISGLIYERQGHGKSDPFSAPRNANYLHDAAKSELRELLEIVVPIEKKIILIGHSDGGSIALLYAAFYPKRIAAVVTMAAHCINEPETRAGIYPAIEAFQTGKLTGLQRFHGDKTKELFNAWSQIWLDESFLDWNICSELESVNSPCLFLQGADDQYGTELQLQLLHQSIPNSTFRMIEHCKHHPHLEQINEVVNEMKLFFQKFEVLNPKT